jgi:hypothetical protein
MLGRVGLERAVDSATPTRGGEGQCVRLRSAEWCSKPTGSRKFAWGHGRAVAMSSSAPRQSTLLPTRTSAFKKVVEKKESKGKSDESEDRQRAVWVFTRSCWSMVVDVGVDGVCWGIERNLSSRGRWWQERGNGLHGDTPHFSCVCARCHTSQRTSQPPQSLRRRLSSIYTHLAPLEHTAAVVARVHHTVLPNSKREDHV